MMAPCASPKPFPTIQDVAEAAGVSTATVSRVLNRPDAVREVLREKVEAACFAWATCRMRERAR